MGQEQVKYNLPQLLLSFVLVIVAIGYIGPALLNKDPLWFAPFSQTPEKIIVYRDGRQVTLKPGDQQFNNFTKILNSTLSSIQTIDLLGTNDATISDYRAKDTAVEVLYPKLVKLKSSQNVGDASAILIPLTGVHTERPRIFTGIRGTGDAPPTYLAGTPVVRDLSPLRQAVDSLQF
jgi:hypothetical protein